MSGRRQQVGTWVLLATLAVGGVLVALLLWPPPEAPSIRLISRDAPVPERQIPLAQPSETAAEDSVLAWQEAQARDLGLGLERCGLRPVPLACSGRLCVQPSEWPESLPEAWHRSLGYAPRKALQRAVSVQLGLPELDPCGEAEARPDLAVRLVRRAPTAPAGRSFPPRMRSPTRST